MTHSHTLVILRFVLHMSTPVTFIFDLPLQVFIFYGPRCNSELLNHSGFVYADNSCDRMTLQLGKRVKTFSYL